MKISIDDFILSHEYELEKFKFIKSEFSNCKVFKTNKKLFFTSSKVNSIYSNFELKKNYSGLSILPYVDLPFKFDGHDEPVRVYSNPRVNRLLSISYRIDPVVKKRIIKIHKYFINLKKNKFKDQIFKSCGEEILNIISSKPDFHVDYSNLDPKLKKLLMYI